MFLKWLWTSFFLFKNLELVWNIFSNAIFLSRTNQTVYGRHTLEDNISGCFQLLCMLFIITQHLLLIKQWHFWDSISCLSLLTELIKSMWFRWSVTLYMKIKMELLVKSGDKSPWSSPLSNWWSIVISALSAGSWLNQIAPVSVQTSP